MLNKVRGLNLAMRLTLLRMVLIPMIALLLLLPMELARWLALALFVTAAVTDWLDGYVARRYNQSTRLGQLLDPIADKLLVAAVLMVLLFTQQITLWGIIPAVAIMLREIFVAGLREFLAADQVNVAVSGLAKWKTATQFVALGVLMIATLFGLWLEIIGHLLLWVAAGLSVLTAWHYWRANRLRL